MLLDEQPQRNALTALATVYLDCALPVIAAAIDPAITTR